MTTLILKRASDAFPEAGWARTDTDWCVLKNGVVVGSIKQRTGGPHDGRWAWSVTAVVPWRAGFHSGDAESLEAAKRAFKQAWLATPLDQRLG